MKPGNFKSCGREIEDTAAPDEGLISQINYLKFKAESGELHGLAFTTVCLKRDGSVLSTGSGYSGEGVLNNIQVALGGLTVLEHRILHDRFPKWNDGPED